MPINAFPKREPPPQLRMRTNTAPVVVEQDGSFQMDKVIKSGWLMKRNRKTKVVLSAPLFARLADGFFRAGNAAGSSSVATVSPPTKTRRNTKSTARSTSTSSPLLPSSRTRNAPTRLASSHPPGTSTFRATRQRIRVNGLTASAALLSSLTAMRSSFSAPLQTPTTSLTRSRPRLPTTQT